MARFSLLFFVLVCGVVPIMALGGVGVYLIIVWQKNKSKSVRSQSWLVTKGEVTALNYKRGGGFHGGEAFSPVISYRYSVGEQTFTSQRFSFGQGPSYLTYQEAEAVLDQYQPGDEINVYYNPDNPEEAVLERQPQGSKSNLVIGIVLLVPAMCALCGLTALFINQIIQSL